MKRLRAVLRWIGDVVARQPWWAEQSHDRSGWNVVFLHVDQGPVIVAGPFPLLADALARGWREFRCAPDWSRGEGTFRG